MALLFLAITIGGTTVAIFYVPAFREAVPNYQELASSQNEIVELESQILTLSAQNEKMDSLLSSLSLVKETIGSQGIAMQNARDEAELLPQAERGMPAVQPFASPRMVNQAKPSDDPGNVRIVYVSDKGGNSTSNRQRLNFFVPVRGNISNKFDIKNKHYGVDIVAPEDELVHAATDGFVILAEYSDKDGHVLGVAHPDNIITFYKHNSRLLKQVGSPVVAGEPIAVIGNSGINTSGQHLHFEVWDRGHPVDPLDYYAGFK